jgi:hypothetical protein
MLARRAACDKYVIASRFRELVAEGEFDIRV